MMKLFPLFVSACLLHGALGFQDALNFNATFGEAPAPFSINIDPNFISETKQRVYLTRFPVDIDQPDFTEGPPVHNATTIRDYWVDHYDWSQIQDSLNKEYFPYFQMEIARADSDRFSQFTTTVHISNHSSFKDAVPLHFVHHRSPRDDAIPLLFIHGWPGSFLEVGPLIRHLTHPEDHKQPAFHVVAPSIPGFAFSPAPTRPGFGYIEAGHSFHALMHQLGYHKYAIQGGDAGGIIMRYQAHDYPQSVMSGLNNFWVVSPSVEDRARFQSGGSTDDERAVIQLLDHFITKLWGYGQIHQTRPLRLAHALTDSPMGLAMWIYDSVWMAVADTSVFTPERIVTWTMMHWIQGPYAPMRIYKEGAAAGAFNATDFHDLPYVKQPMAISEFPKDLWYRTPLEWAQRTGNVTVRYLHKYGGHFPAWENPLLLAGDIRKFFGNQSFF